MSDRLRRLYNRVDRLLDRRALIEVRTVRREVPSVRTPLTARAALRHVLPVARGFDRGARLKLVAAQGGLDDDGTSPVWELFFDLPSRRAKLACELRIAGADGPDGPPPVTRIEATARPFPSLDSPLRRLAKEGTLLHRQVVGRWRAERRRTPDLPHDFRDSDAVLRDLERRGLDPSQEFAFSSGVAADGRQAWQAQTKRRTYWTSL